MCVVSNRCHYDKFYICKTCNTSAKKEKIPFQAMVNGFQLENVHKELIVLVLLR